MLNKCFHPDRHAKFESPHKFRCGSGCRSRRRFRLNRPRRSVANTCDKSTRWRHTPIDAQRCIFNCIFAAIARPERSTAIREPSKPEDRSCLLGMCRRKAKVRTHTLTLTHNDEMRPVPSKRDLRETACRARAIICTRTQNGQFSNARTHIQSKNNSKCLRAHVSPAEVEQDHFAGLAAPFFMLNREWLTTATATPTTTTVAAYALWGERATRTPAAAEASAECRAPKRR